MACRVEISLTRFALSKVVFIAFYTAHLVRPYESLFRAVNDNVISDDEFFDDFFGDE